MPEFRLDKFSGGVTDYFVNASPDRSQRCDNLLIDRNAKLYLRPGSVVEDVDNPLTPLGNTKISRLVGFRRRNGDFNYFKVQGKRVFALTDTGHEEVLGISGRSFFSHGTVDANVSYDDWNDHIIATVSDQSGVYAYPAVGFFPAGQDFPVGMNCGFNRPKNFSASGSGTYGLYTYAIHYEYKYLVGDVEFVMRGAVEVSQTSSVQMNGINAIELSFDAFDQSSTTANFDVGNIKLRIFRSVANGTVMYHVADIDATDTTYTDTSSDELILDGEFVYITGGQVDYEPAPLAKYCTILNGIAYYANFKETEASTNALTYRIQQSIPSAPYSTSSSFYVDVDGEITGINRFANYPIVFTQSRVYRLEGNFNADGTGYIRSREIGSTTGCVSNNSIVRTPDGLFFAGVDGFYFTDGQSVKKISRHLDTTYPKLVRNIAAKQAIQGQLDEISGRIFWTVSSGAYGNGCDKVFVLDPYWGMSDQMTFTTLSGGADWTCSSILFNREVWYRASIGGYTYVHSSDFYTDPVEVPSATADTWASAAVIYDWSSAAINFGTDVLRKWVTQIVAVFKNETNLSVAPFSCNDVSDDWRPMKPVRHRGNLVWGQPDAIWGGAEFVWRDTGNIIAKRMFPAGTLRCTHKQVKFTNSNTVIIRSDDYAPAIINSANGTFLLTNYPSDSWPPDIVGYSMCIEHDGYVREYEILSVTDDTVIVDNTAGTLMNGTWKWIVKGYRKGEKFVLDAVTLNFTMFGDSQTGYQRSEEGGNA